MTSAMRRKAGDGLALQPVLGQDAPDGMDDRALLALLLQRQDGICAGACGQALAVHDAQLEHAVPRIACRGDEDLERLCESDGNAQAMCGPCNSEKRESSMSQMAAREMGGWLEALRRCSANAFADEGLYPKGRWEFCGRPLDDWRLCGWRLAGALPRLCEGCWDEWPRRCEICGTRIPKRGTTAKRCDHCRAVQQAIVYEANGRPGW